MTASLGATAPELGAVDRLLRTADPSRTMVEIEAKTAQGRERVWEEWWEALEVFRLCAEEPEALLLPAAEDDHSSQLSLSVNGTVHRLDNPSPSLLLSDFLRSLGLTGVKVACGEGGCGSCTVIAVGKDGVIVNY